MKRRASIRIPLFPLAAALLAAQPAAEPLRLRVDGLARLESGREQEANGSMEIYGLYRTRVGLEARSGAGASFVFEGQDAGAVILTGAPLPSDHFDVHQAFVALARPGGRWQVRLGRQELAFGDERLVGADSEWCYMGRSFDAARVSYLGESVRLDWFASFPVTHADGGWNRPQSTVGLHGFDATWKLAGGDVGAYWIWKSGRGAEGESRYTSGLRHTAAIAAGIETNAEFAWQTGRWAGERVRAWAGHAEVSRKLWAAENAPVAAAEYNYGSPDAKPDDGLAGAFDDLFPAGHDRFGLADPFPWSNIRSAGFSLEWRPRERLEIAAGWRRIRPAASESEENRAGQFAVSAAYDISGEWRVFAAYARYFQAAGAASGPPACSSFIGLRRRF
ncbi:MAG: alginate export family protein [Bryobacteraceae bacterium]|nr:alginate export family protein [Bryobacteraceae bacterium]